MDLHDFQKQNLVNQTKGDFYKCSKCGVSGWRMGLAAMIKVTESDFKASLNCDFKPRQTKPVNFPKEVLTNEMIHMGIGYGIHKVVDCPPEHIKYKNDVWIFSDNRKEPVRLLAGEYEIIS